MNRLIVLSLIICILLPNNILASDVDPYQLRMEVKEGKILLSWNSIPEANAYLINIYEDGIKVESTWVYDTSYSVLESKFNGNKIRFMVAAPSKSFSEPIEYNKETADQPVEDNIDPYQLGMEVKEGKILLSWNTIPEANAYLINIYEDGIKVESTWVYDTSYSVSESKFNGNKIRFMVAAPSKSLSGPIEYNKETADQPVEDNIDPYQLGVEVKEGKILLSWNTIPEAKAYLINIYEEGTKVESTWVYDTSYSVSESKFNGNKIRFMVAAPSKSFSEPIEYEKQTEEKYEEKPVNYNPIGAIEPNNIWFSWSKTSGASYYYLQLYKGDGTPVKQNYVYNGNTIESIDNLPNGEYKWRVIPLTSTYEQGIPSDWSFFIVENSVISDNVFGVEKSTITPPTGTTLSYPETGVYGPDGALYVADTHANVIKRCTDNECENYVGTLIAGKTIGDRREVKINMPTGISFDIEGNMFFSDIENHRILKVNMNTDEVTEVWKHNYWVKNIYVQTDGSIIMPATDILTKNGKILKWQNGEVIELYTDYQFKYPVALYSIGNKTVILDHDDKSLLLFIDGKFSRRLVLDTVASGLYGIDEDIYVGAHTGIYKVDIDLINKESISSTYANVSHIAGGKAGELLITDSDSGTVSRLNLLTLEKELEIGSTNVASAVLDIHNYGNNLYFLDNQSATIWKYDPATSIIERFIGNGKQELAVIGNDRLDTSLFYPSGFTIDNKGNFYISEQHHILKVSSENGKVELFAGPAGRATYGYNGENVDVTEAYFQSIYGLDYDDDSKSLYVADAYNNRIRKIQNGKVTTVAGNGTVGSPTFGQPATLSQLNRPHDVMVYEGEVYIADSWNNIVSKIDKNGILLHVAGKVKTSGYQGNGNYSGDFGNAEESELNTPLNLFYENGMLYVVDTFNSRIRVVNNGKIYTIIGNENKGYDTTNPKTLNMPNGVYVDEEYIYVADTGNYLVRRYKKQDLNF